MSSYFEMKQPTQAEINRKTVNSISRQLMKNRKQGISARASNIVKGSGSNKNKKNALVKLFTLKQQTAGQQHRRLRRFQSRKHRK
jgi:hypothetical protein